MWRVDFFFKINKRDSTFIREMRVHTKKRSSFSPEKMSIDGRSSPSPSPSASGVSSEIIEVLRVGLVAASTVIVLVLNRSGAM